MIISNQPQQNGIGGLSVSAGDELKTIDSGKLANIVEDTSPQLGGNLDVVTHSLISTSNRNIAITPNGSGKVVLDGLSYPTADGTAGQAIVTDGAGNLTFSDVDGAFTGLINASDTNFHSITRENTSRNTSILEFKKDIGSETSFDDLAVPMLFSLKNNSSTKYLAQIKADNDATAGKRITFASVADNGSSITEMVTFHDTDGMNIGSKKITNLTTPTNASDAANKSYVDTQVASLVDSAPGTLDTLNELAAALGDDANFATTTATSLGEKLVKTANLSDLANASTARTNLGLGTAATTAATDYATAAQGTKADTAHGWGNHASAGYLTSVPAQSFASLTGKPTTIAGYGITNLNASIDAHLNQSGPTSGYVLSWNGSDYAWVAQSGGGGGTFALAGNSGTHTFNTATETLTFLGTTGQINAGIAANNVTLELDPNINSIVSISFEGATADNFETKLQAVDPTADRTINLPDADGTVALLSDISSGGSQSRVIRTNQTSSLVDGAEADLDITGFKSYALLSITTDRAARVRLYVNAATRTADVSRAEGVDPTSDAGLIAEVITTGTGAVIISPGAYGFNLENFTTSNIPCRVTNKSGSTSTVQVSLNILQLEA